mmetsp:Transcript_64850/g.141306  ORF Transcript_64850/g.141306 Transcript_64850/m.141306 type:complete len:958 (-) Transcript_64850:126-2999(-)
MHFFEKTVGVARELYRLAQDTVSSPHSVRIFISNGTNATMKVVGQSEWKGSCTCSFKSLSPGHAGLVHFAGDGDTSGSVELEVGDDRLLIAASSTTFAAPSFSLEFAKDETTTYQSFYKAFLNMTKSTFMGLEGDSHYSMGNGHVAYITEALQGADSMVHVTLGLIKLGSEGKTRSASFSSGSTQVTDITPSDGTQETLSSMPFSLVHKALLLETLESSSQLAFAEWCQGVSKPQEYTFAGRRTKRGDSRSSVRGVSPKNLGHVVFLMEFAGLLRGITRLDINDRAFTVNLLVSAFVLSGALNVSNDVLGPALKEWRDTAPQKFSNNWDRLNDYMVYRDLGMDLAAAVETWFDRGLIVLRTAALQAAMQLSPVMEKWDKVEPRNPKSWYSGSKQRSSQRRRCFGCARKRRKPPKQKPPTSPTGSSASRLKSSASSLFPHYHKWSPTVIEESTDLGIAEHLTSHSSGCNDPEDKSLASGWLVKTVQECIHESAEFSERREEMLLALKFKMTAEEAQAAMEQYCRWVSGSRRRFKIGVGGETGTTMRVESWGPEVCAGLDMGCTCDPATMISSLGRGAEAYKSMSTNSKSGEFFFFSADKRFIIKTISEHEGEVLFRMMPEYQCHLRRVPRSLIVRYGGLYRAEMPDMGWLYFTVMASVFDPEYPPGEMFDVKGSTFKRKAKQGEKVGKDEDWCGRSRRLNLDLAAMREFRAAHEQDAAFMMAFGVMDYSLLIGIHTLADCEGPQGSGWREGGGMWSNTAPEIYFVGLIDFLISYGVKKQTENLARTLQGHGEDASCVDPETYALRQVRFVRSSILPDKPENRTWGGTRGTLIVSNISADNLRRADILAKSDPYCVVSLGLQKATTATIRNNLNPRWTDSLSLAVDEGHLSMDIELSIWDEDHVRSIEGSDDLLGKLRVKMSEVLEGSPLEIKKPLEQVKRGTLSVCLEYVPTVMSVSL